MIFGLLPVAGIGLPFVSYGPSFLALDFCLVALVLNITARQSGRALIPDGGGNDPI
ncbi:lipid II flippase FtsW [Moorella thermoacetica]|nr:lipid II flippase FtsW [Moorella thermoacetica]